MNDTLGAWLPAAAGVPSLRLGVAIRRPETVGGAGEGAGEGALNSKLGPLVAVLLPNILDVFIEPFCVCSVGAGWLALNEKEGVIAGLRASENEVELTGVAEKMPFVPFDVSGLKLLKIVEDWVFVDPKPPNPAGLAGLLIVESAPKKFVEVGFSPPNMGFFALCSPASDSLDFCASPKPRLPLWKRGALSGVDAPNRVLD